MEKSDDYKQGWYDGFQAAQKDITRIYPTTLPTQQPFTVKPWYGCAICNMDFKGAMGYVCPRPDCPSRVTC